MKVPTLDRLQVYTFAGLSLFAFALACVLSIVGEPGFARFLPGLPPLAVFAVAPLVGGALFVLILGRAGFSVIRRGKPEGAMPVLKAAATLGAVGMVLDLLIVLPRDMNIPFPRSLAFYPAIGFLAEIVFHVLPLSILLIPFGLFKSKSLRDYVTLLALAAAALPETLYQLLYLYWGHQYSLRESILVALHVFAINGIGLWLFRRYDFVTMWAFRMVYYLFWHVIWGALRLYILF